MPVILAAAAAESDRGWGGPLALIIACAVFWLGTQAHARWKSTRENPSPTPALEGGVTGVKQQVTGGSDTSADTTAGRGAVAVRPLDEFVAEQVGQRPTMEIVRDAKRRYGASKATVIRAIRKARAGREVAP